MTLPDFVNRLLTKRAVVFVNSNDSYVLLTGERGSRNWELIGTDMERPPLTLKNCLSYDELKCSAFLSVSSSTYFINIGNRYNEGTFAKDRSNIEDGGIIIGIIGPRFEKANVMEYQEIVVSEGDCASTTLQLFTELYNKERLSYGYILNHTRQLSPDEKILKRYKKLDSKRFFDNHLYSKRLALSFDTLLLEANYRAKMKRTTAFVHVVGFGLGVWRISSHQPRLFMTIFASRIEILGQQLLNISDICFSYINEEKCGAYTNGQIYPIENHPCGGIKIHIRNREPHEKLTDKLSGNALPGNEFWTGSLCGSGDPAAAASTQIAELHNPHINPTVSADSLMIATTHGVKDFDTFVNAIKIS